MAAIESRTTSAGQTRYFVRVRDKARGKFSSATFATRAEAEQFCKEVDLLGADAALDRYREGNRPAAVTIDQLFAGYIAWKETGAHKVRSDRTLADYRRDYRNWIHPTFGRMAAQDIDERAVQRWLDAMTSGAGGRKPLSAKSVTDRHALLHAIYKWGIHDKGLLANPCVGNDIPKRRKAPPKAMRPAEWQAIHSNLTDPDAADFLLFLASTGWRFSEAAALNTYGVEDYGDDVFVTVSRVVRRNAAGQHAIVEDTKSEAGARRIGLPQAGAALVRRRMVGLPQGSLVFTTKLGSQWHYSNLATRHWQPAVKAANIGRPLTIHSLRHSHVVWLALSRTASLAEIQRRIGHEHISTTIGVYGSMIQDVSADALAALDGMLTADGPRRTLAP